jgi:glycerol-3-phosphate dehydrogenase
MPTYDFTVVGAGRMGASIAGHLVLQGARVALFDRSDFDRCASRLRPCAAPATASPAA